MSDDSIIMWSGDPKPTIESGDLVRVEFADGTTHHVIVSETERTSPVEQTMSVIADPFGSDDA